MPRLLRKSGDAPRRSIWQRLKDVALSDVGVLARGGVKQGSLEELEQLLIESDFGVPVSLRLVAEVEARAKRGKVKTDDEFRQALVEGIEAALRAGNGDPSFVLPDVTPAVVLIIGVNGAGKTTFIGKLSAALRGQGKRVMVAAGDTFRAGAIDQLRVWAERTGAEFV
ncbi:MAG TPA: signal recognition particle receptor subunit alpha, partial [Gemmatimonadaceae bacterium]